MNKIRSARLFKRLIAYLLCFVTFAAPYHAIAAEVTLRQAGQQGQSFAEMLLNNMQQPTESGGTINFPDLNESIEVKDLYPGSSGTSDKDTEYFESGSKGHSTAESNYEYGSELDQQGLDQQYILYEDAVGGDSIKLGYSSDLTSSPSIQGAAYKIILDKKNAAKPDMRNDPLVNSSRDIFNDLDDFSDCKLEQIAAKKKNSIHLPEFEICERINKPKGDCEIEHVIEIETLPTDVVFLLDNSASMDSAIAAMRDGAKQFAELLGDDKDRLRIGGIITRDGYASNRVPLTNNVNTFQHWVNGVRINSGTTYVTDVGNYVLNNYNFRADVQKIFVIIGNQDAPLGNHMALKQRMDAMGIKAYIFHDNNQQKELGTHVGNHFTVDGLLRMAQMLTVAKDEWTPRECINDAIATLEEFCSGTYTVTEKASPCSLISGFTVCPGDPIEAKLSAPPIPNVNKLDAKVYVNALQCDFNIGEMGCFEDALGNIECPVSEGNITTTCGELEKTPQCGFIKSDCIGGASGKYGTCYVFNEVWDCGKEINFETDENAEEYVCDGPISCMGEECVSINRETSDGFGKVAALLNVVEHADGMLECGDNPDSSDNSGLSDCSIFSGEKNECKKAVGGMVDCCEKPKDVSLGDYLTMLQATKKIDSAMLSISQTSGFGSSAASQYVTKFREPVQGAYNSIKKPIVDGFKEITSPFVNYAESAGANYTITQKITEQVMQAVYDNLGSQAKSFLVGVLDGMGYDALVEAGAAVGGETAAGDAMAQTMGQTVGSIISFVGWVYLAYQVATLIIQMIYKCTKPEMELMVNVQLKKCSYVGSYCASKTLGMCTVKKEAYCCYDSPLARIVVEQGYKQLGKTQGPAKAPQCDGLTLSEMSQLDWDRIDLSEWTGMLIEHNLYAGTANLNSDSITGKGSYLPGENGERMNVEDRTDERFKDTYVDDIRVDFSQKLEFSGGKKN